MSDQPPPTEAAAAGSSSARRAPPPPRSGRGRRYWLAVLALALALAAGVIIGASGAILYMERMNYSPRPNSDEFLKIFLSRMEELIVLTAEEKAAVDRTVRPRFQQMERLREEFRDEIRGQFEDMSEEVREVIGPERYKTWEEYRKKRFSDRRHQGGNRRRHKK
ncbi:MAG: hypothetical protein FWG74_08060 [Planctomycetes bacterium]|nr:hypothetical protein [Planctomycetota bacterium]